MRDGVEVSVTDIRDGDVFTDWDGQPWRASRVGRDGEDVHIDIQPVTAADAPPR
ncbi:hypothetical protein WEI85_19820 [Actinomycetes bacterium KLBMP 9797]